MNLTVEKLEKNMAKLTVEVGADVFEAAIKTVYNKQKGQISVPGFRKGKVPQAYLEKMYGAEMFYEDAANEVISNEYPKVFDETDLEIVSSPEVEVVQAEPAFEVTGNGDDHFTEGENDIGARFIVFKLSVAVGIFSVGIVFI